MLFNKISILQSIWWEQRTIKPCLNHKVHFWSIRLSNDYYLLWERSLLDQTACSCNKYFTKKTIQRFLTIVWSADESPEKIASYTNFCKNRFFFRTNITLIDMPKVNCVQIIPNDLTFFAVIAVEKPLFSQTLQPPQVSQPTTVCPPSEMMTASIPQNEKTVSVNWSIN